MREILFRGKRKDNGEWFQGDLLHDKTGAFVCCEEKDYEEHYVLPETVGQFTGLTDKNGKKIFEGDTITWETTDGDKVFNKILFEDGCFVAETNGEENELLKDMLCLGVEVVSEKQKGEKYDVL